MAMAFRTLTSLTALAAFAAEGAITLLPPKATPVGDKYTQYMAFGVEAWTAADLEGDGVLEFIVATTNSHQLVVYRRDPGGVLVVAETIAAAPGPVRRLYAGDVDGDGRTDLVVHGFVMPVVQLLRHAADGSWLASAVAPSDADRDCCADAIQLFDWDGDGDREVLVHSVVVDPSTSAVSYLIEVQRWDAGSGGLAVLEARSPPLLDPRLVVDLDGDGGRDLVGKNWINQHPDDADGGVWISRETAGAWPAPVTVGVSDFGIGELAFGDFDGDGDRDIALGGGQFATGPLSLQWFSREAGDAFAEHPPVGTGTNPAALAAGDLDRDGRSDVVAANSGFSAISVSAGSAAGLLSPAVELGTVCDIGTCAAQYAEGMVGIHDVNGDGAPDVVLGDPLEGLQVFYNAGGSMGSVDLGFEVATLPTISRAGQVSTFRMRVRNLGARPLTRGMMLALLPRLFTPVATPAGCTVETGSGVGALSRVRCPLGAIAVGAAATFEVRARYAGNDGLVSGNDARVVWWVDPHEVDSALGDNRGFVTIAVEDMPETLPPDDGGGGGGSTDAALLAIALLGLGARRRRTR